jgi:predicted transcriptional regulator
LLRNGKHRHKVALEVLLKHPDVTGAELERREPGGQRVRATAWNNRLKDLYEKRLLRRVKRGREHLYSPVVPEVTLHE